MSDSRSVDSNEGLREALSPRLRPADDVEGLSRFCPHCGKAGVPSSSNYKQELVSCVTVDCPVYYFRLDRTDGGEPA